MGRWAGAGRERAAGWVRKGERLGCWAAGKGSGPLGLVCLGWAGEKGRWAMGRFELVWAFLIPFLFYF